ncbi:MAG: siderophore-interacting protein [Lacisediminihabitans sp.]
MIERRTVVRHDFAIRQLTVARTRRLSPSFVRVTVTGPGLASFASLGPTDHTKLFFADAKTGQLAAPRLTPEGLQSPEAGTIIARDYTPRDFRQGTETCAPELDLDFVLHADGGPAAAWAQRAEPGDALVAGGPRGSLLPPSGASRFILVADESALPALARWIEFLPDDVEIIAFVELADESDAAYLEPVHVHRAKVIWLSKGTGALERALRNLGPIGGDSSVWVAGEATALIPIRRYLRRELGLPPGQVTVDGYWKLGEAGRDHHAPIDPSDPDE